MRIENETLKVIKTNSLGLSATATIFGGGNNAENGIESVNKDKLIYELGKDGANTVINFLDEISTLKSSL